MGGMKAKAAPIAIGVFLVFLMFVAAYVGSYAALVRPVNYHGSIGAYYRFGGTKAHGFYRPIHRIDRRLRPWVWEPYQPTYY